MVDFRRVGPLRFAYTSLPVGTVALEWQNWRGLSPNSRELTASLSIPNCHRSLAHVRY
jgi:hypothetical protein